MRTEHDIPQDLIICHLDMADRDAQTQHLFELEFDSGPDFRELVIQVLGSRDGGRELAS